VREAKQTERISSTPPLQLALALTCLGVILLGVFPAPLIELVTDVLRFLPL
jgi:NADH:ubiquinone oxidoreductase subunit 2 (subunit N)